MASTTRSRCLKYLWRKRRGRESWRSNVACSEQAERRNPDPAALVLVVVLLVTKTWVTDWRKLAVSLEESVRRDSFSAALKRLASAVRFRPRPPSFQDTGFFK